MARTCMAQNGDQRCALVNMVMDIRISNAAGNFWTSVDFSRRKLLHAIS
jgi:hypothetical protein